MDMTSVPCKSAASRQANIVSLLFHMELAGEEGRPQTSLCVQELDVYYVAAELRQFLLPSSNAALKLSADVESIIMQLQDDGRPCDTSALGQTLAEMGYSVCIRQAVGGSRSASVLHNLRHASLAVTCPGSDTVFTVDPSFSEQFWIAKPNARYLSLLSCLPQVLVIPDERVPPLVMLLCSELAAAFKANDMVLPPWRQADSMLTKWRPRTSLEVSLQGSPARQPQADNKGDERDAAAAVPGHRSSAVSTGSSVRLPAWNGKATTDFVTTMSSAACLGRQTQAGTRDAGSNMGTGVNQGGGWRVAAFEAARVYESTSGFRCMVIMAS